MSENLSVKNGSQEVENSEADEHTGAEDSMDSEDDLREDLMLSIALSVEAKTVIWMKTIRNCENQNWINAAWKRISAKVNKPGKLCEVC